MNYHLIFAECLGALAVILNFIGYRQHDLNKYLLISAAALACLSAHFFMINALAAGISCALACSRNIIALYYRGNPILVFFVLANIAFFSYEWWWLGSEWVIFIAYASSLIFTIGSIVLTSAKRVKQWFIFAEGLGLMYSILVGSIFGTVFNTCNLISIFYSLYKSRHNKA
ncbi:YgjV family protein [Agaribacter flavus]|uniref:YgjV family protein n=1 Tax=Agaribacter flavus TaxID=1902781 RepID=A0ABV7FQL9_9ALTE